MRIDGRGTFIEREENHDKNRGIAEHIRVSPALLADGSHGVFVSIGRQMVTLNKEEVADFTQLLRDALEEPATDAAA